MNQKGRKLAIWGVALQFGTVFGLIGTIIGMLRAFGRLGEIDTSPPGALANDISIALYTTAVGYAMALVGIIFIFIALFSTRYRSPWFLTALWILSVLWLLNFPIGTVLGVIVIVYLVNHKEEFTEQSVSPNPPTSGPVD
jgi:hypothetical protein